MCHINYVYGQPSLLIKQCFTSVYKASNNGKEPPKTLINNEQKKLKGSFIENLYLSRTQINSILYKKNTKNELSKFISMLVISCFTCRKTVIDNVGYSLLVPDYKKIKSDIDNIIFNNFTDTKTTVHGMSFILTDNDCMSKSMEVTAYKKIWDAKYLKIIAKCREIAEENWVDGKPSENIMKMFRNGYIYGTRDTSSKKWNWLKGLTPEQAVDEFLSKGILTLGSSEKKAIQRVNGLSIKAVNDLLKQRLSKFTDEEIQIINVKHQTKNWFDKLQDKQKENFKAYFNDYMNKKCTYKDFKLWINLLGYSKDWIINGKVKLHESIVDFCQQI